jgi:hypothetical protein
LQGDKSFDRPVIGPLNFRRKETGGQFARFPMIADTLAANTFTRAWLISAIAFGFIVLDFAFFHPGSPALSWSKWQIAEEGRGFSSNLMPASLNNSTKALSAYLPNVTNRLMRALTSILAQRMHGL